MSSNITAIEKIRYDLPLHAKTEKSKFVDAIKIPAINMDFKAPNLIENIPPSSVKITVVIHPKVFEYNAISDFEKPTSL